MTQQPVPTSPCKATASATQPTNINVNLQSAGSADYLNTDVLRLSTEVGQLRQELQGYTQLMHQTLQVLGSTLASIQATLATMLEGQDYLHRGSAAAQQARDSISQLGLALGTARASATAWDGLHTPVPDEQQ